MTVLQIQLSILFLKNMVCPQLTSINPVLVELFCIIQLRPVGWMTSPSATVSKMDEPSDLEQYFEYCE